MNESPFTAPQMLDGLRRRHANRPSPRPLSLNFSTFSAPPPSPDMDSSSEHPIRREAEREEEYAPISACAIVFFSSERPSPCAPSLYLYALLSVLSATECITLISCHFLSISLMRTLHRLKLMSSPSLSELGKSEKSSPEDRGEKQKRAGANATWNSIHNAVIAVFQKKGLADNELYVLNEGVRHLLKTELGSFFTEYLQNQLLTKGMVILRDKIRFYEGQKLLDSLAETWDFFFCDVLSMLQAIFHPVQGKEPSVRQLALLHFRNTIVLSVKLEDALSRPRARVPPSVTQMLLILQGVHESRGVNEDYLRLESLVQKVVSPYLGTHGLHSGDSSEAHCCVLEKRLPWGLPKSADQPSKNPVVRSKSYNIPLLLTRWLSMTQMPALLAVEEYDDTQPVRLYHAWRNRDWRTLTWPPDLNCLAPPLTGCVWALSSMMKMSLAQRVLLSWIFALIFLIMLVLKLDSKIHWNWFLIFLPVWTFDTILILMLIVKMAGRCKPDFDPRDGEQSLKRRLWYLTALLLKLAFCLTLCSRLENFTDMW
ncbi:hypothetical protein INR49_029246, partial [Caranx melampygus]